MKRVLCIILVLSFVVALSIPALSHNADKHNEEMSLVLLGKKEKDNDKLELLEAASYLALDQCKGKGADKLLTLQEGEVKDLPKSIDAIDFPYTSYHRRYTHKGWNYDYSLDVKGDIAHWEVRKGILCSTTNKVFKFGLQELGNHVGEKCDSFSALIYYVHVLGDHSDKNNLKKEVRFSELLPFADNHVNEGETDLFFELKTICLERLFKDQMDSKTYKKFIRKYDRLAEDARSLQGETGGIRTEEQKEMWAEYKKDLLNLLKKYIPKLLKQEEFFAEVFYPDYS
jgi:hypothetical protein